MIELTVDIDEQLRAGQAELEAHLEAQGIDVPVRPGTVRRRGGPTQTLPQPSRQLLAALEAHRIARAAHDAEAVRLANELANLAARLYHHHAVQATEIAALGGVSRKAVYVALGRKETGP